MLQTMKPYFLPQYQNSSNEQIAALRALGGDQSKLSQEERYRMSQDVATNLPGWIPAPVRAGLAGTALTAFQLPYDALKGVYAHSKPGGMVSNVLESLTGAIQPGAGFNRVNTSAPNLGQYKGTLLGALSILSK